MKYLWERIQAEPNSFAEVVRAGMYMLLGFGLLDWDPSQQALVLGFVSVLLAWATRKLVMPTQTIEQAGQSVSAIKHEAKMQEQGKQDVVDDALRIQRDKQDKQDRKDINNG